MGSNQNRFVGGPDPRTTGPKYEGAQQSEIASKGYVTHDVANGNRPRRGLNRAKPNWLYPSIMDDDGDGYLY